MADDAWAQWVGWQLHEAGFEVNLSAWWAAGTNKIHAQDQAARADGRTLVLLSPNMVDGPEELPGWSPVFTEDPGGLARRLVPVIVEACQPKGLLAPIIPISLVGLDEQEARQRLLDGLDGAASGRARPHAAPPFPPSIGLRREPTPTEDLVGLWPRPPEFPGVQLSSRLTDLLDRVADAYREQFPGVRVARKVSPDLLRYLEVETELEDDSEGEEATSGDRARAGRNRVERRPVGVWAGDLDGAALERFVGQVHARC